MNDSGSDWVDVRQHLRHATQDAHQRLHLHPGFAAIQNETIALPAYRALLLRLYGFYLPFEAATEIGTERSRWLREDIEAVSPGGVPPTVPLCPSLPLLDTAERRLGALYMVEGSALGGRGLARHLERLFGPGTRAGRCFFLGRGAATGEAWTAFLARLAAAGHGGEIVAAAVEIFTVFEAWLGGWGCAFDA